MVRALSGTLLFLALIALAGAQTAHAQNWQLTDGAARDVGVGADGSVWVIGTAAVPGGYGIYRRTNNTWVNIPGGAERIAVDPQGHAWVVNNSNTIFRHDGTKWLTVNGSARDIGVGANGTVWVIGTAAEAGGYGIYRSTDKGANWTKIPGAAVRISVDPQGHAWVVNSSNNIFRHDGTNWVQLVGAATDIGIGADGAAWVIGTDNGIYRWENSNWAKKRGGAAQIAAGPSGLVWVVNQGNQIFRAEVPAAAEQAVAATAPASTQPATTAQSVAVVIPPPNLNIPAPTTSNSSAFAWARIDGSARDVGVGADGSVWAIGTNAVPGGYGIYRRANNTWTNVPGGAERIAVDPQGNAWVVNNSNTIFRHDGSKWVTVAGQMARDIGVGANGTVWVIGNNAEAGGYGIYRSADKGASWTKIPGSAVRISGDPQGHAWVVNKANTIFRFDGSTWVQQPGAATDVGIGADGAAWVIGTDNGIYRWEGSNWARKPGGAAQIAAGPSGAVWVVNHSGEIFQAAAPAEQVANTAPAPASGPIMFEGPAVTLPASPTASIPGTVAVSGVSGTTGTSVTGGSLVIGTTSTAVTPGSTAPIVVSGGPASVPGPVGASQATCGVPGKGLCRAIAAQLVGNADVTCPSGSFPDLGRSACFSCPEGFTRSIHAVDNYKACQKSDSSVQGGFMSATFKGRLCGAGSFYDPIRGGECYSCPGGYNRSAAHIDASNACYVPIHETFSAATKHKTTIWPHECSSGTFWDGYNSGACYSCPGGYRRTAYHITDGKACVRLVGESHARATLVKKAECGPGEIRDIWIQGAQDPAAGGGCWVCPTGTDRTILPANGSSACERAPGVQWASATRVRGMTCEPSEIYDPVSSGNSNVASALAARNAANPSSPVSAKTIGGTCWTCPSGHKRTGGAVYGTGACMPPDIVWQSALWNQPGLFGLQSAEEVALALVTERTVINRIIAGMRQAALDQGQTLAPNYAQTIWDEIGRSPQDSAALKMAVFSRVVAAANQPANATAAERLLLSQAVAHLTAFRVFMANDALSAYYAWRDNQVFRKSHYAQSRLQVMTDVGQVPPDFEEITAANIMGSLATTGAATTLVTLGMTNPQIYKELFPFAKRTYFYSQRAREGMQAAKIAAQALKGSAKVAAAMAKLASSIGSIALSAGPQIIVTIGTEVLYAAIEQQIEIANAEPKLKASLATAQNVPVDFARLMATEAGTAQAEGYWSQLMSGPVSRDGGATEPPAIGPRNLQAFAQQAAVAKQALIAAN